MTPRVFLLVAGWAAPLLAATSEKPDWRFAHPQAELMIGVNVRALLDSPLLQEILREEKGPKLTAEQLDVLSEVEGVYLSIVTRRVKGKPDESDGLVMIKGNFGGGKLMPFLQKGAFPGKSGKGAEELTPRFVNLTTILLGDEAAVDEAVHRLKDLDQKELSIPNPLFTRAAEMDDANDLWVVGSAMPLKSELPGPQAMPPGFDWLDDIRSFALGLGVRRGLNLDLALNMRSKRGVEQLMGLYQQAAANAGKDPKAKKSWDEFSEHVQVTASASSVKFNVNVPEERLRSAMDQLAANAMPMMLAGANPGILQSQPAAKAVAPAPPPQPPVPQRRTVVIYGMEGGAKEVRLQ